MWYYIKLYCIVFSCILDYDGACDAACFFLVRLGTHGALYILLTMEDLDTLFVFLFVSVALADLFYFLLGQVALAVLCLFLWSGGS